jgi:hypothetical protein
MAPMTRSQKALAREVKQLLVLTLFSEGILTVIQAAEVEDILARSQAHDSNLDETTGRPTKRPRINHETKVQDRTTEADASRQAVLQTNELLENILMFLPPTQLFADQRVCKQWHDVIASCPQLQKRMFLRVDEVPPQTWGFKTEYSNPDPSTRSELRRFHDRLPSLPWRQVTPVILSPHLTILTYDDGDYVKASVDFDLPHNLPIEKKTHQHSRHIHLQPAVLQFRVRF